ncbi:hypothetical protein DCAR_0209703 [Daucus carota subsp. sativus]|uniref:Uncharacterized protein n=2 Tax=Daucus carota subsp. sativus TaxID=79200 RepID=A0A161XKF7_DAUCS|nr:hypothetical protein DCAR_0209703 [Daucus carota subsp. sativus]
MGTSQIGSRNYLPVSTSNHSSLYRINYAGIGTSGVRLAPPSYSPLNVSTWAINDGNMHKQYSLWTEVNGNIKDDHAGEEGDKMLGILNKRPCINTSDIHATSSSPGNSAFPGLRMANDGKSLVFGDSNGTEVVSTKRNDFNVGNGAQDFALPPFPDSEDQFEEPSLPPLPEFYVEYSLPQLETTNTSLPPITSQWNPNTDMASYSFVSHEDFLSPLPSSEMPLNLCGDVTTTNFVPQNSLLPPLASESQCNVNPDASSSTKFFFHVHPPKFHGVV